jgi:hypothetical protein
MITKRPAIILFVAACVLAPAAAFGRPVKKKPVKRPLPAATAAPSAPSGGAAAAGDTAPPEATPADDRRMAEAPPPDAGPKTPPAAKPPSDESADEAKESAPPAPAPAPPPPSGDLAKLRADYDRLRGELFRARARAQIVQEGLYPSRLAATLRWNGAPGYALRRAEVRLDGASIWDSGEKPLADSLVKVAERPVKPGPHALTVRLEIRPVKKGARQDGAGADAGAELGYTSEHTFAIVIPEGKRVTALLTGDEDGDAPEYEPQMELELEQEK